MDQTGKICTSASGGSGGGAITAAPGSYSAGALVDGAISTLGSTTDTAYTGSGSASEIAIEKGIYNALVASLPAGTNALGSVTVTSLPAIPAGSNSIGSVTVTPPAGNSGTPTQATGSCTTSSSTILTASAATTSETFHLATTAANPVWLNFAGAAATTAAPNFDLQPGGSITFTATGGLLPTAAITCIASASTSVTEIYK